MVNYCAIIGCTHTGGRDNVSFYRLPAEITHQGEKILELSRRRRRTWLSRISREDLTQSSYGYVRVCSSHFVSGKPSALYDDSDVDWAPSLNLGHQKVSGKTSTPDRGARNRQRDKKRKHIEVAEAMLSLRHVRIPSGNNGDEHLEDCEETSQHNSVSEDVSEKESGICTQTDVDSDFLISMECEIHHLTVENAALRDQLASVLISQEMFKDDDKTVKLYTSLPSYKVLNTLFMYIEPYLPYSHNSALTKFQQMMLLLIRLKLNLPVQYIADRLGISAGTVSKVFLNTLHVLFMKLEPLIYWPDREELRSTMPLEFRRYFGLKVAVIVDCFEIFIERPSNLKARAQTWSSYKHHNTCKYLIGITPQGSISFISKGYGGRVSDKYITNDCGLLDKLVYGDLVLADRGFDIAESVAQVSAELKIPAFTKGRSQLSAIDVEQTRKLAHVRIHVERVIGLVRNKFKVLQDTLPLDYLISHNPVPTIDKIVTVCCALTNICKSVVPFD